MDPLEVYGTLLIRGYFFGFLLDRLLGFLSSVLFVTVVVVVSVVGVVVVVVGGGVDSEVVAEFVSSIRATCSAVHLISSVTFPFLPSQ